MFLSSERHRAWRPRGRGFAAVRGGSANDCTLARVGGPPWPDHDVGKRSPDDTGPVAVLALTRGRPLRHSTRRARSPSWRCCSADSVPRRRWPGRLAHDRPVRHDRARRHRQGVLAAGRTHARAVLGQRVLIGRHHIALVELPVGGLAAGLGAPTCGPGAGTERFGE